MKQESNMHGTLSFKGCGCLSDRVIKQNVTIQTSYTAVQQQQQWLSLKARGSCIGTSQAKHE